MKRTHRFWEISIFPSEIYTFLTTMFEHDFPCNCITLRASFWSCGTARSRCRASSTIFSTTPSPRTPPLCWELPRRSSSLPQYSFGYLWTPLKLFICSSTCASSQSRGRSVIRRDWPTKTDKEVRAQNGQARQGSQNHTKKLANQAVSGPLSIFTFKANRAASGLSGGLRDKAGVQKLGKSCSG